MASRSWLIAVAAARFGAQSTSTGPVSCHSPRARAPSWRSYHYARQPSGRADAGAPPRAPRVTGYLQGRFQSIGDSACSCCDARGSAAEGNLTTWATYKLQAELRTGGTGATTTTVGATDLYLGLAHGQWSGRVGQFKTPFSRELLQGDDQGELPERSVVVDSLAPSRDVGFMAEWKRVRRLTVQGASSTAKGSTAPRTGTSACCYVGRAVFTVVRGVEVGGRPRPSATAPGGT